MKLTEDEIEKGAKPLAANARRSWDEMTGAAATATRRMASGSSSKSRATIARSRF
jgi:hypothetical protein